LLKKIFLKRNYLIILMLVPFMWLAFPSVAGTLSAAETVLDTTTKSLSDKTRLVTSKVVYEIEHDLKSTYPDKKRYINSFVDLLTDEVLRVDRWSDIQVSSFTKEKYDDVWMQQVLKDTLKSIFEKTRTFLFANEDPSCKFAYEHTTLSLIVDFIDSAVTSLWVKTT